MSKRQASVEQEKESKRVQLAGEKVKPKTEAGRLFWRKFWIVWLVAKLRLRSLRTLVLEAADEKLRPDTGSGFRCAKCEKSISSVDAPTGFCLRCSLWHYASWKCSTFAKKPESQRAVIAPADYLELWLLNRGRCGISDRFLLLSHGNVWQASPERRDSYLPYSLENINLIAYVFNVWEDKPQQGRAAPGSGSPQWSREKFQAVKALRLQDNSQAFAQILAQARAALPMVYPLPKAWLAEPLLPYHRCCLCQVCKPNAEFGLFWDLVNQCYAGHRPHCRTCVPLALYLKGKLKFREFRSLHQPITIEHALNKLEQQQGRCVVSKIPMCFEQNTNWKCMFRKINDELPYSPDNFEFICGEFRLSSNHRRMGLMRWTSELFNEFWAIE